MRFLSLSFFVMFLTIGMLSCKSPKIVDHNTIQDENRSEIIEDGINSIADATGQTKDEVRNSVNLYDIDTNLGPDQIKAKQALLEEIVTRKSHLEKLIYSNNMPNKIPDEVMKKVMLELSIGAQKSEEKSKEIGNLLEIAEKESSPNAEKINELKNSFTQLVSDAEKSKRIINVVSEFIKKESINQLFHPKL